MTGAEESEELIRWLPRGLSSLTLVLRPLFLDAERFSTFIGIATRILKSVGRTRLSKVQVESAMFSIAELGIVLSGPDAPLEACKSLEETLLTFPASPILIREPILTRRAGRAAFWSPLIKHAFSKLNDQGRLRLDIHSKWWLG